MTETTVKAWHPSDFLALAVTGNGPLIIAAVVLVLWWVLNT